MLSHACAAPLKITSPVLPDVQTVHNNVHKASEQIYVNINQLDALNFIMS